MDYILPVDVLTRKHQLVDVAACFYLVKALSAAKKITQRLVLTDVQHQVHIFCILKVLGEAYHVLVMQGGMNLNLTC